MKFLLAILLAALPAFAETIYVAQSSAGSDTGADASNAHSMVWLNTSGNWGVGAGKVSAGDTVVINGTITSALTIPADGSAGSPITISFASGAKFSAPHWPSSTGAINLNGKSYITIDGVADGKIENTSNGTGLATQLDSAGVGGKGTNIVIANLTVTNIYKNIAGDANRLGYPLDLSGSIITITNCNLSDGDGVLSYTGPSGTGGETFWRDITIINNRILNFNHGINFGWGNSPCIVSNVVIAGNLIDYSDVFDEVSGSHHLDDIIFLTNTYDPTVQMRSLYIYGNTFGSHVGVHNTAAIFSAAQNAKDQIVDAYIFNNLFIATNNTWGNGMITLAGSNVWVFNNTSIGAGGTLGTIGGKVYNNLDVGMNGLTLWACTPDDALSTHDSVNDLFVVTNYFGLIYSDFNVWASPPDAAWGMVLTKTNNNQLWVYGAAFHPLSAWQTWYANSYGWTPPIWNTSHADPHSVTTLPSFQNGTYVPVVNDTIARGQGTNLTSLGVTTVDFFGNARASSGNWTIGAFDDIGGGGGGGGGGATPVASFTGQGAFTLTGKFISP